jgi:hypothetical protein
MSAARVVAGGVFAGLMVAAVGGVAYMVYKSQIKPKPKPVNPINAPLVNENVNPNIKPLTVQTAVGYQDVKWQQVTVDTKHLDDFWQYQGLIR